MASETDFLNDALGQISQPAIASIDDGTPNAVWCKTYWPQLRKALLRAHHWNFAEDRVELAQEAVAPLFEFSYAYALPADLVKIKVYNGNIVANTTFDPDAWMIFQGFYKVEGRSLYSNDGQAKIVYVKDVENPNLWDALFYQAASAWLASKLALPIRKDPGLSKALLEQAMGLLLPLAAAVDGQEGSVLAYAVDDLTWGR